MSTKNSFRKYVAMIVTLLSLFLIIVSLVQADEGNNNHQIQSDKEQLSKEIELRQSIGFRSDIDYVQAVHKLEDVVIREN